MPEPPQTVDTIVLGLGAMGSAALYHLARRGVRALGIDRFSPPHAFGSSHGDTRITRLAIGEGEHYTPLALRSHELWRELEAETGDELLTACGGLILSSGSATSHTHVENFFDNTLAAARRFGIDHEVLDAAEIRRRFPPFRVSDAERGYYEPDAGFLRPERCVAAHLRAARRRGATLRCNETATAFRASSGGVSLSTDRGVYSAANLIVAAGAWLPGLVGADIAPHFTVYRQTLSWFEIEGDATPFEAGRCPIFIWELTGRPQSIYGFPAVDGARGGVKIASERFDRRTDPDAVDRDVSPEEIAALHRDYVAPYVAGVGPRCLKSLSCLYTVTPDFGFVLDRHPGCDRVVLASPCSGHGFKHSPAIGEALAATACGAAPRFDLSPFALSRFEAERA
jgi:sarcosine oxidase